MSTTSTKHNIYQLFINSCKKHAKKKALYINQQRYSYQEFLSIISGIRKQIKKSAVKQQLIGFIADEHINTYASIWAIISLGAGYVPLNKKHPIDRVIDIIKDAEITSILYAEESAQIHQLKEALKGEVNFVKTETVVEGELDFIFTEAKAEDIVYLLYTSGSTGKPKGVAITHQNLMALVQVHLLNPKYDFNAEDRFLQMFELTFDFSVLPTLFPPCAGASIYVVPQNGIMYLEVLETLTHHKITKAYLVPSVINYLQDYFHQIDLPHLKWTLFCGEALYEKAALGWQKCAPNSQLINTYGPTEASVYMTEYTLEQNNIESFNGIVSIGKAVDEMKGIVVDENLYELPKGEKGELLIFGAQTTTKYWKNEEKSKESFVYIEYKSQKILAYKTGDICFENEKGNFFYCDRKDHQIKINGYRIELGEVEFHAKNICPQNNLVAFAATSKTGTKSVVLCIEKLQEDKRKILSYLKEKLPPYMIPGNIFSVEKIPLNSNGKTDREAIKLKYQEFIYE
jgi:D-alanine--poly(phosphoribitol) ligase subunit 1